MENASPDPVVIPNPQTPKTFGILNIVFGALLLLCNVGSMGMILVMPALARMLQAQQKKMNDDMQKTFQAEIDDLKAQEAAAEDPKEKAELQARRTRMEKGPRPVMPSMTIGVDIQNTPEMRAYTWADYLTAFLLNIPLLISGLGLVRLREWGRKLALWVAGLKLARLAIIFIVAVAVILPATTKKTAEEMKKMDVQMKKAGAPANPAMGMVSNPQLLASISTASVALNSALAAIYPAILIWGMTRPSCRAATLAISRAKPEGDPWASSPA